MVRIGQEQSMVYGSDDLGPFNLSADERENRRHDTYKLIPFEKQKALKLTKKELMELLMKTDLGQGLGKQELLNMCVKDLQEKDTALFIGIERIMTSKLQKGWYGKPKGMLQVMWERGFVDESKLQCYKIKALNDSGEIVPEFFLENMVKSCHDFLNEMFPLEHVCRQLSSTAVITTKYHAEFAGEGIEYSWGFSKSIYRRSPLKIKKGKENFDKLVSKCISRGVMKKKLIRRFSKRAQEYMLSYQSLEKHDDEDINSMAAGQCISQQRIEEMKLLFKSHQAAIDFDKKLCGTSSHRSKL
jgi:hypothetical protein